MRLSRDGTLRFIGHHCGTVPYTLVQVWGLGRVKGSWYGGVRVMGLKEKAVKRQYAIFNVKYVLLARSPHLDTVELYVLRNLKPYRVTCAPPP